MSWGFLRMATGSTGFAWSNAGDSETVSAPEDRRLSSVTDGLHLDFPRLFVIAVALAAEFSHAYLADSGTCQRRRPAACPRIGRGPFALGLRGPFGGQGQEIGRQSLPDRRRTSNAGKNLAANGKRDSRRKECWRIIGVIAKAKTSSFDETGHTYHHKGGLMESPPDDSVGKRGA